MRVAIVQKDLKNLRSGVSRLVFSELQAVRDAGYQATLISERVNAGKFRETGATIRKTFRWPMKGFFRRYFFALQARFYLKRTQPSVSIAHGDIPDVDICFIHNCVHLEHEIIHKAPLPVSNDVGRLHSDVLTRQQFQVLVCNSQIMRDDLVSRYGILNKRIEILYPSCDPDSVTRPSKDMRQLMSIAPGELVIGLVTSGNFKKRNVQLFLEATAAIRSVKTVHVVVAGNGDPQQFSELTKNHPHSVHFLPSSDDVANYYAMLDIFVLPAHIEEFGMSALEAMTCGKPVVLHRMVGASEILEGESRRFALTDLSINTWISALEELCSDSDLRRTLGQQNQETAKKYTAEKQNERFMEIVHSVAANRKEGAKS